MFAVPVLHIAPLILVAELLLYVLLLSVDNEVPEGKRIDYKEKLSIGPDKDKKEFLADVTSFANTSGGYLIYGIIEDKGIAIELKGIHIDNAEDEINKMENIIKQGVEPRIHNVHIIAVELSNSNYAFVIKIGQSLNSPHRVTIKGHDKFYSRASSGKFPMDVSDLRTAFTLSETNKEIILNFRSDRVSKIVANQSPIFFSEDLKLIVHLIPFDVFSSVNYDLSEIVNNRKVLDNLSPIYPGSANQYLSYNHNSDGFLVHEVPKEGSFAYIQLFRNGIIESVHAAYPNHKKRINVVYNERDIIRYLSMYLKALKNLGVNAPISIFLSITGAKDYSMHSLSINAVKIDEEILNLPEVIIENYNDDLAKIFKPVFDMVWQACGYEKSSNYDENGKWLFYSKY